MKIFKLCTLTLSLDTPHHSVCLSISTPNQMQFMLYDDAEIPQTTCPKFPYRRVQDIPIHQQICHLVSQRTAMRRPATPASPAYLSPDQLIETTGGGVGRMERMGERDFCPEPEGAFLGGGELACESVCWFVRPSGRQAGRQAGRPSLTRLLNLPIPIPIFLLIPTPIPSSSTYLLSSEGLSTCLPPAAQRFPFWGGGGNSISFRPGLPTMSCISDARTPGVCFCLSVSHDGDGCGYGYCGGRDSSCVRACMPRSAWLGDWIHHFPHPHMQMLMLTHNVQVCKVKEVEDNSSGRLW